MKFWGIFHFEFAYQLRRVPTWLYFAVLLIIVVFQTIRTFLPDARSGGYFLSAPFVVAQIAIIDCLIWLLTAAYVAGDAGARDAETGMHPLSYTAPVSKAEYLGGRFLAAFVLNAGLLLAVPVGVLIGLYSGGVEDAIRGPFRPATYLTSYLFIALPIVFVTTAIQFSFAALSRRAITSYLGGILLMATTFVGSLLSTEAAQLMDLFGVIMIEGEWRGWRPAQLNTQLIGLEISWLASRVLWIGLACGALALTYVRFRLAHPAGRMRRSGSGRRINADSPKSVETTTLRTTPFSIPQVPRAFGLMACVHQTLAIAWRFFASSSKSPVGLVLLTIVALLSAVSLLESLEVSGVPLLVRTDYVLNKLISPEVPLAYIIIPLLLVFWSGELVWAERDARMSEIVDATPVPEWVFLLGKLLGLGLVLVLCMAMRMLAGVLVQVNAGYSGSEIGPYLQILFGLQLTEYLLLAALSLVIHVVVNQKHVGHLATLAAFALIATGTRIFPDLLAYASGPSWIYTDMLGFGGSVGPWLWSKLYWSAWALLLLGVTKLLWVRGREEGLGARFRLARRRFTPPTAWAVAAATGLILTLGGFIFYNTNVLNEHPAASNRVEQLAEYERRYGRYENLPQPRLVSTSVHVEIYPDRRKAEIRGTYRLVNQSAVAIDSIHLATALNAETGSVSLDRPTARVFVDDDLGHRIYTLETALQPGDSLQLSFEVRFEPRGFRSDGQDVSVAANGTHFTNWDWLPAIGYQRHRELSDAEARREHGLAPPTALPSSSDIDARHVWAGAERIAFEAVVATDEDQIAIAPGALRRTWTEGGRRYFHYSTDAPIQNQYAFLSAAYAVIEGQWNDVEIRILHHPGHTANLDRMLRSVQASLSYYAEQLGPYPYRHISLVESPGHEFGMHAEASLITFQEGFSLFNPEKDPRGFDLPLAVVAHEVAHQWWGAQLAPARVEGAALLTESLAWYSAMWVVEETQGYEHLRQLLGFMRATYQIPETRVAPPLLRNEGGVFLAYRKGPLALYALSEYIGKERVNSALRRLLEKHGAGAAPLATSLDLYRELQAVTPDSLQYLLHDLFEANTYWELKTERATAEQTAAGPWQITLDVRARKMVVDALGVETDVPMDDWIAIGIFAEGDQPEKPFYAQKHRIRSGPQTITVTMPRAPTSAGIDPNHLLIDLQPDDNITAVKAKN